MVKHCKQTKNWPFEKSDFGYDVSFDDTEDDDPDDQ